MFKHTQWLWNGLWPGWTIYWLARRGANRDRGNKLQSIYIDQIIIVLPFAPSFAVACGHSWHRPHLKPRTCREIVMMSMSSCGFSHYNQNRKKKDDSFFMFPYGQDRNRTFEWNQLYIGIEGGVETHTLFRCEGFCEFSHGKFVWQ